MMPVVAAVLDYLILRRPARVVARSVVPWLLAVAPLIAAEEGFTSLFNGKDLTGWKASEHPETL